MIFAFPDAIPVNIPVTASIVPIPGFPLLHVPPGETLLKVIVVEGHRDAGPVIVAGSVFIVTDRVLWHPVLRE